LLSALWFFQFDENVFAVETLKIRKWLWLSLAAFLLALLAKTSTVMLPVLLLACVWWRHGRLARRDWLRAAPYFLLALVMGGATFWFQTQIITRGDPVQQENFFGRLAAAGMAVWFYFGKVIFPFHLSLIYPRWQVDATAALSYLSVALWAVLLALLWLGRSRGWSRAAFFGLGCFTAALFPVLGFLSMDFLAISRVSDHFQYLPMIAVIALIAAGASRFLPAKLFYVVSCTLIAALCVLTFQRAQIIASDETLWRDTLEKNPGSFTAHNNLGCLLAGQNQLDAAMEQFQAALQCNPRNASAHCNLGRAFSLQHKFADAENEFQAALKIKFADADIQQSYAAALLEQGKIAAAIPHLREAVRVEPRTDLRLRLAALLHETGNAREAVEQYRAALRREPDSIEALNNLAWLLATSPDAAVRNGADAVRFAEQACRLTNQKNPGLIGTLAAAYAEAGRFNDAVETAGKAAALAEAAGNSPFAQMNRQLQSLYRTGRPFREPAPDAAR
jgi:tetratricopeptide (TPR) repeat protein